MKPHGTLNRPRTHAAAVTINSVTFIFGGPGKDDTYEYLPKESKVWILGKQKIPEGMEDAYAIAIESKQEILLIGGKNNSKKYNRILKFSTKNHTFEELPTKMNYLRAGHRCAFIPGTKKIIITGGMGLTYTEIFDTENYSITKEQNQMNVGRSHHGIGIVTINDEDRLAVFGGMNNQSWPPNVLDSVEIYNANTQKWEMSDIKLKRKNFGFGFLSVKLKDVFKLNTVSKVYYVHTEIYSHRFMANIL